jgi:hypothetical protein
LDLYVDFCGKLKIKMEKRENKTRKYSPEASEDIEDENKQPKASKKHSNRGNKHGNIKPFINNERKRYEGYHQ